MCRFKRIAHFNLCFFNVSKLWESSHIFFYFFNKPIVLRLKFRSLGPYAQIIVWNKVRPVVMWSIGSKIDVSWSKYNRNTEEISGHFPSFITFKKMINGQCFVNSILQYWKKETRNIPPCSENRWAEVLRALLDPKFFEKFIKGLDNAILSC